MSRETLIVYPITVAVGVNPNEAVLIQWSLAQSYKCNRYSFMTNDNGFGLVNGQPNDGYLLANGVRLNHDCNNGFA